MNKAVPLDAGIFCTTENVMDRLQEEWSYIIEDLRDDAWPDDFVEPDYEEASEKVLSMAKPDAFADDLYYALQDSDVWERLLDIRDDVIVRFIKQSLREITEKGE